MTDGRASVGRRAEALAAEHLERCGMRIVARNWRRPEGELDLVALDSEGTCVFCEVRSRTGDASGDALEAISPRKRAQVVRLARLYLATESLAASAYRFDVVAVTFSQDDASPTLIHIPAAFETSS
ncbi:MAG: YraN family protein [Haliangium ochraceum]